LDAIFYSVVVSFQRITGKVRKIAQERMLLISESPILHEFENLRPKYRRFWAVVSNT
jgi:hypothetical protein